MRRIATMLTVGALLLALSATVALAVNQSGTAGDDIQHVSQ